MKIIRIFKNMSILLNIYNLIILFEYKYKNMDKI